MDFKILINFLNKLNSSSERLKKTFLIYSFLDSKDFKNINDKYKKYILQLLEGRIFPIWETKTLGVSTGLIIKSITQTTGFNKNDIEKALAKKGDLGLVTQDLISKRKQSSLFQEEMSVEEFFDLIEKIYELSGQNSQYLKINLISQIINNSPVNGIKFIIGSLLESIRLGVGSSTIRDAFVWLFFPAISGLFSYCNICNSKTFVYNSKCIYCSNDKLDDSFFKKRKKFLNIQEFKEFLEKNNELDYEFLEFNAIKESREAYNYLISKMDDAYNYLNDFSDIYFRLRNNQSNLFNINLELYRPLKSMLFLKANTIEEAFEKVGKPCAIEYKYDGFRCQIHVDKNNNKIKLFTRGLEEISDRFPELRYVIENISCENAILDGEIVSYDYKNNKFLPFQTISQRIIRKYDIDKMSKKFPVIFVLFDMLMKDNESLLEIDFKTRRKKLDSIISTNDKVTLSKQIITDSKTKAQEFFLESIKNGNEGVMYKKLDSGYKPGSRVGYGMKLKEILDPLDLVIVKAYWGEGKRTKWFTSFTVACIDEDSNLKEIGKVSTGLKELEESGVTYNYLTELIKPLIKETKGKSVIIEPNIVIQVGYEEIQKSDNYDSGFALRFPRFISLREKSIDEIDTVENVKNIYVNQRNRNM